MATPQPPFALAPSENHVLWKPAGSLKGISLTTGRVWLTTDRVVFQPVVLWVFWLAPLVGLIMWLMNKAHRLDLPLSQITSNKRITFGRNPNVLVLGTATGEHKLIVDDFAPFAAALIAQPAFTPKQLTS
ncbi:MAG: hypothetical protein JWP01_30 [Myxococcales bacterium]|nr:hypothetical protein [Myxococcales bacterium]